MKQQINFRASDLTIRQLAQLQNLTGMSQTELISTAVDRMYREEKMNTTTCYLENPWSGTVSQMTWGEIKQWSRENVHESARKEWLEEAQKAAKTGDSKTLGIMIIGS